MLVNARSVNNNSILIWDIIVNEAGDLAHINKTWLSEGDNVNLFLIYPPGFGVWHLPWAIAR